MSGLIDPKKAVEAAHAKGLILTAEEARAERWRTAPQKILHTRELKADSHHPRTRYVTHRPKLPLVPVTKHGQHLYLICPT